MRTLCISIITMALLVGSAIGVAAQEDAGKPLTRSPMPSAVPPWPEVFRTDGLSWEPLDEPGTWTVYSDPHGGNFPGAAEMAIGPDGRPWFWEPGGCGDPMSDEEVMCTWQMGTPGWSGFPPPGSYWLNDLAVTDDGTLWAATQRGLRSFDGKTWSRHGGGDIGALAVAPDGSIWGFGSGEGFVVVRRYSGNEMTEQRMAQAFPDYGPEPALVPLDAVAAPDGDVWVGGGVMGMWGFLDASDGFLARFDGETWDAIHPLGEGTAAGVIALAVGPDAAVWAFLRAPAGFGDVEPYLARFDGQGWTTYSTEDGLPGTAGSSLAVDPDGTVWLTLDSGEDGDEAADGVVAFDGQQWIRYLEGRPVDHLAIASDGTVFATAGAGTDGNPNVVAIRPRAAVHEPED